MNLIPWHHTDLKVSPIALGAMRFCPWNPAPGESESTYIPRTEEILQTAIDSGINLIDHADIYGAGRCESVFAAALQRHPEWRSRFVLQSKCGIRTGADSRYNQSKDYILQSVDGILSRLQVEQLDVLLLHRPDPLMQPSEVAAAFTELKTHGKVRYFGVSNFSVSQMKLLQASCDFPLVANQIQLSLLHPWPVSEGVFVNRRESVLCGAEGLVDFCHQEKIQIQAWSPLAGGSLFQDAEPGEESHLQGVREALQKVARELETSPEAVAVQWLMRHPANIVPVVGTVNPKRLRLMAQSPDLDMTGDQWWQLLKSALGRPLP